MSGMFDLVSSALLERRVVDSSIIRVPKYRCRNLYNGNP